MTTVDLGTALVAVMECGLKHRTTVAGLHDRLPESIACPKAATARGGCGLRAHPLPDEPGTAEYLYEFRGGRWVVTALGGRRR